MCGKKNYVQNAKKGVSRSCLNDVIPGQQQENQKKDKRLNVIEVHFTCYCVVIRASLPEQKQCF